MKWWHAWRHRVWYFRYLVARGKLSTIRETSSVEFYDAEAERATAESACNYHWKKLNG